MVTHHPKDSLDQALENMASHAADVHAHAHKAAAEHYDASAAARAASDPPGPADDGS